MIREFENIQLTLKVLYVVFWLLYCFSALLPYFCALRKPSAYVPTVYFTSSRH